MNFTEKKYQVGDIIHLIGNKIFRISAISDKGSFLLSKANGDPFVWASREHIIMATPEQIRDFNSQKGNKMQNKTDQSDLLDRVIKEKMNYLLIAFNGYQDNIFTSEFHQQYETHNSPNVEKEMFDYMTVLAKVFMKNTLYFYGQNMSEGQILSHIMQIMSAAFFEEFKARQQEIQERNAAAAPLVDPQPPAQSPQKTETGQVFAMNTGNNKLH